MRVRADGIVDRITESKELLESCNSLLSVLNLNLVDVRHEVNELITGHLLKKDMLVGNVAEVFLSLNRVGLEIMASDDNFTELVWVHTGDALDGRGFTRTVVSENTDYLTLVTVDIDILDGVILLRVVLFRQPFDFNQHFLPPKNFRAFKVAPESKVFLR